MNSPSEYCRIEIKIPNDVRALGAVRGALAHSARHLGFSSAEEEQLTIVTEGLLGAALGSLPPEHELAVSIQEHPNRLEVELVRPGAVDWATPQKLEGIDQVQQETGPGLTRLKLVKFVPSAVRPHEQPR